MGNQYKRTMAAESDCTWRKILSFFGAAFLLFIGFVTISSGVELIVLGEVFNGAVTCVGGCCAIALCVILYLNYERWSLERRSKK